MKQNCPIVHMQPMAPSFYTRYMETPYILWFQNGGYPWRENVNGYSIEVVALPTILC